MALASEKLVSVVFLERPVYSVSEAARLLQVHSVTLRRWLDGSERAGVRYPPVIREESSGSDVVTWGEFVEAGFLREYRERHISLQKMRPFIEKARAEFEVPYPLAAIKPKIDNKKLVYTLQKESGLDPKLYLVDADDDQIRWAEPVRDFLEKVEFNPAGIVSRFFPLGTEVPVVIDPEVSFGVPQIRGIRTELVAESVNAGEPIDMAARSWDLKEDEVEAALTWERSIAAAA
jgi:uncharacterized protein (DUF433 family)